jgi:para-nitrobenzyl esterase
VSAQTACFVTLSDGREIQGSNLGPSCAFLGVPYGASTAGENRWRLPQPAPAWSGALNATSFPPNCAALNIIGPAATPVGDEDCLKLNVWVRNPKPGTPVPVIVWLHTGAFIAASANFPGTRGQTLAAERDVIVVTPNYRLGAFGFLAHSALSEENSQGASGNYGLMDQQAALRWVRDNIAAFGGDPGNVTLAGTSAGGQSVGLQMVSPASQGLFHRAVIQSAYPTTRWTQDVEARAQGEAFASRLGCDGSTPILDCLRAATRNDVLMTAMQGLQQVLEPAGLSFWEPTIDGVVIPDEPRTLFESGQFHRVPTIVGFNRDEGWGAFITRSFASGVNLQQYEAWVAGEFGPYAPGVLGLYADEAAISPIEAMAKVVGDVQFVCEARRVARAIERTGTPTYMYSYEYLIDSLSPGHVIHGVESNLLFGNNYGPPLPVYMLTEPDFALHRTVAAYWTQFAATGNPNRGNEDLVSWPPFTRPRGQGQGTDKLIVIDKTIGERAHTREAECNFFEPLTLRSVLGGLPAAAQ